MSLEANEGAWMRCFTTDTCVDFQTIFPSVEEDPGQEETPNMPAKATHMQTSPMSPGTSGALARLLEMCTERCMECEELAATGLVSRLRSWSRISLSPSPFTDEDIANASRGLL